jgi:hypothetical protein
MRWAEDGKLDGKTPLRRKDIIKMNLKETRCEGMEGVHMAQDRDQ